VENLKITLKKQLHNAGRVALLGLGSKLRGDDAAGIFVARTLSNLPQATGENTRLKVFIGDTAPENLTGEIKKFNPTHLIIVDSADMHEKAGVVKLIDSERACGFSSCTHSLPLKILTDYLFKSIGCRTTIIGIQPKTLDFGSCLSVQVKKSAEDVSRSLKIILKP